MLARIALAILWGIVAALVAALLILNIPGAAGFSWAIPVIGVLVAVIVFSTRPSGQL